MYVWHTGNRWYALDLHLVVTDFKHLSLRGTKVCIPAWQKSVSSVCNRDMTICFASACVANCLPSRSLVRGLKRWKTLVPILPTGRTTGYGAAVGRLWTTLPRVPVSCPAISIRLDSLKNIWLGSDLQQTPTWSNLYFPVYRHSRLFSLTPGYSLWCHGETNA
jgi:hypothetical protein